MKILRFIEPAGLQETQVGVTVLDVDLHIDTNNFAANKYRGVVNPSVLAVYKGSKHKRGKIIVIRTESKIRK